MDAIEIFAFSGAKSYLDVGESDANVRVLEILYNVINLHMFTP